MNKKSLYLLAFLIKGWESSLLLVLPIIQIQGKITVFELGIAAATFSAFQILTALFAGNLAEKVGNKKMLTFSIAFYAIAWLMLSLPINIFILLIACSLGGVGLGIFIPLANSQIAKIAGNKMAQELGDFSAFSDVGRVVLVSVTTFLIGSYSLSVTSYIFVLLAIIATILMLRIKIANIKSVKQNIVPIKFHQILKIKRFIFAEITGVFDVFASSSLFIFIPLLLIPKGIQISAVGFLTALFFGGYMIGRMLLGRLADKYGSVKTLIVSEIFMASLIILLIFIDNFIMVASVLFMLGVFTRGTGPVIRAMMVKSVEDKEKYDKAFSLHSFTLNLSNVASRSVYGFLAGTFGIASVFYLSAAVALSVLGPLYLYRRSKHA